MWTSQSHQIVLGHAASLLPPAPTHAIKKYPWCSRPPSICPLASKTFVESSYLAMMIGVKLQLTRIENALETTTDKGSKKNFFLMMMSGPLIFLKS